MDIGHLYSPPTELYHAHKQQRTSKPKPTSKSTAKVKLGARSDDTGRAMVDNKGWRKKIGGKPRDLPSVKTGSAETAAASPTEVASESRDRLRHGWRKTITASRPLTPMTPAPTTPTPDDVEDKRRKRSEAAITPRRDSKPRLIRYTSLFASHKEESTSPILSEPWSIDILPDQEDLWAYVDPIVILESIHSHMCKNYMAPIPLQYSSGLFQIFDDYRKLRSRKELLEARERDAIQHSRKVIAQLLESEALYESEIHRLELLIARGTDGMTGLMQARQGTVVDRKRQHRNTISTDCMRPRYQYMSPVQLDEDIRAKSQQVLLYRPTSPSRRMTALSLQLTNTEVSDLPKGTDSQTNRGFTLSREVKSELNLMDLRYLDASQPVSNAAKAAQSSTTQDVSQKVTAKLRQPTIDATECDAFVALKELGALVARRKGLDVTNFVSGVIALLASAGTAKNIVESTANDNMTESSMAEEDAKVSADDKTPRPPFQKPRSQSYQEHDQKCQRHFSFEPGDDQMRELEIDLKTHHSLSQANSTDSEPSSSVEFYSYKQALRTSDDDSTPWRSSLGTDFPKPSLIPSPVQTAGRKRQEESMSSLQTVFVKNIENSRHKSRTSSQTAFREASSANASTKSKSRHNSSHSLRAAESPLGSKDRLKSLANRHSTAALAAARAAELRSSNLSRSNTQLSTATSSFHQRQGTGLQRTENKDYVTCANADQRDAK